MKKVIIGMMAVVAVLATSCDKSYDDVAVTGDKTATVSVSVGMPEAGTRVFADGETANKLQYAVYEVAAEGGLKLIDGEGYSGETEIHLTKNLSFTLLKDHSYGLVFWAAHENAPYTAEFAEDGAKVSFDVENMESRLANDDKLDAFFAYQKVDITGDGSITVQLHRPFAQINIGTNDYEQAKALGIDRETLQSYVSVYIPGNLDLVTGEVSDTEGVIGKAVFSLNDVPQQGEPYPVKGYEYLAMAYVMVGSAQETIDVTFGYTGGEERTIGSVPVQRNYRTNIYGSLLTGKLDVNVEIEPDTDGDKDVMLKWDGVTLTEPAYDEATSTYTVSGADELAWLAQADNNFENDTIVLESDLDLGGHEFTAFASGAQRSSGGLAQGSTSFKGVFDGNGKTISGFKAADVTNKNEAAAFITNISGEGVVKNVTFENVEIVSTVAEQAGVVGIVCEGATVENVKVMGGKVSSVEAAGGIVGRVLGKGTVKDCENHADVSTTAHNVGGIVGAAYYNNEGMTISGCDNYGKVSGSYGAGGIVGLNCGDVENCNNYGTNVTGKSASVGGIVGEQKGSGSIKGCTNRADVAGGEGSTSNYGCGGIVGWVRYTTEPAYTNQSAIEVSGCTNEGKHITGAAGVGGIVGVWYSDGECKENTNLAETITASGNFAAGIVGNSQWTEVDSQGGTKDAHTEGLKLTVNDNVSYTAEDDIKAAGCTHLYVYINDQQRTTQENNTNPIMTTVNDNEALKSAVTEEDAYIKLEKGTYTIPTNVANGVTFEGDGNVVFEITGQHSTPSMKGSGITFKKVKMVYDNNNYHGLNDCSDLTYIDCEFEGQPFSYAKGLTYSHCTFNQTDGESYNIWTYTATPVTFEDCTFNCAGKALLIYNEGGAKSVEVYIKNCKFYASQPAGTGKAAIEMDSSFHTITVHIDNCTAEGFDLGSVSNNSLWNHKKGANEVTVYVDGQKAN